MNAFLWFLLGFLAGVLTLALCFYVILLLITRTARAQLVKMTQADIAARRPVGARP